VSGDDIMAATGSRGGKSGPVQQGVFISLMLESNANRVIILVPQIEPGETPTRKEIDLAKSSH
jgi:hypothetical protein